MLVLRRVAVLVAAALVAGCIERTSGGIDASPRTAEGIEPTSFDVLPEHAPFQLGDEFSKQPVTSSSLTTATSAFRRAARATAHFGSATGFYLGQFAGVHVVATNQHVSGLAFCGTTTRAVSFPLLDNLAVACPKILGRWKSVDLALVEITVAPADEAKLTEVAANFAFYTELAKGMELATIGFGSAGNPSRAMVADQDADCRVMSRDAEYRDLADPDTSNPLPYTAWSFAHGCDASPGDSGSAMIERATGRPMGILWTGSIPKPSRVQSSAYLQSLLDTDGADIWTSLNYAVPATKIREQLELTIADETTAAETRAVFEALVVRPPEATTPTTPAMPATPTGSAKPSTPSSPAGGDDAAPTAESSCAVSRRHERSAFVLLTLGLVLAFAARRRR